MFAELCLSVEPLYLGVTVSLLGGLFIAIFVSVYKDKEEYEHFSIFDLMSLAALFVFLCASLYLLDMYNERHSSISTVAETPAAQEKDDPYIDLVNAGNGFAGDYNDVEATKSFDAAIAMNPDRPEAYTSKSIIATGTEVMRLLNLALSKSPYGYAYELRADAYNNQGKYKLAMIDATKAIESGNFTYHSYDYRAWDYLNPGGDTISKEDYTQALNDSEEAIQLEPDDSHAFVIAGISLYGLGACQDAIDAYNTAIDISRGGEFEVNMANIFWKNFNAKNCVDGFQDSDQGQSSTTPKSALDFDTTS
jgi:tetratricopeptide (TPR) repeat protein